jgi:hypothetical protein
LSKLSGGLNLPGSSDAGGRALAYPEPLEKLVLAFERFPGIGRRSAERLAFHVLRDPAARDLAGAIERALAETRRCADVLQRRRDGPVLDLRGPDQGRDGRVRRRGAAPRRGDRALGRLPRALPRPDGRLAAGRGPRARARLDPPSRAAREGTGRSAR